MHINRESFKDKNDIKIEERSRSRSDYEEKKEKKKNSIRCQVLTIFIILKVFFDYKGCNDR